MASRKPAEIQPEITEEMAGVSPEESTPEVEETPVEETTSRNNLRKLNKKESVGDVQYMNEVAKAKAILDEQPKIRMMIPLAIGEKKGKAFLDVGFNGYFMQLPKGVYLDLPESIANIVSESFQQTEAAGEDFKIDGDKRLETALS